MKNRSERITHSGDIEVARSNPNDLYGESYYLDGYAEATTYKYGRHEPWLSFFGRIARRINLKFKPKSVADVGCAFGMLTEALVDQGIDAYGFDVSTYAIGNARPDMKGRLSVHSICDPIPLKAGKKYDLAVCIEVLEHLPPEMAKIAIENLCNCSDRVLFSSTPDDFDEPTHFNVLPTEDWLRMFAKHGFKPAKRGHKATFVARHARVVENENAKPASLWALLRIGRF